MAQQAIVLSPDHLSAIGRLVVAVSKIDSLLTDLLAGFMQCSIMSAIITVHHQQLASKVSSLLALMKLGLGKPDGEFKKIFDLINDAKRIADERNTIVHCLWTVGDDGELVACRFTARGEFKRSRKPYSAAKIAALSREADELVVNLARLRDHFPATPLQSPQD